MATKIFDYTPHITPTITRVTVSASKTLAELLSADLVSTTRKVTLVPASAGVYMADSDPASAASCPLGDSIWELRGGLDELSLLEFYAAAGTYMWVIQEG